MTDLLQVYKSNILRNFDQTSNKFAQAELGSTLQCMELSQDIEALLKETEKIIKNYDIEVSLNHSDDSAAQLKEYKSQMAKYKQRLKKLKEDTKKAEAEEQIDNNSKEKLLTEKTKDDLAFNSYTKLQKGIRATIEMESMSNGILNDLDSQSEKMKNVNTKIGDVNDELGQSSSTLQSMLSLNNRNKRMVISFGAALLVVLIIVVTIKLLL